MFSDSEFLEKSVSYSFLFYINTQGKKKTKGILKSKSVFLGLGMGF